MGYDSTKELAWRLCQEIQSRGGTLPESACTALVNEWAPGRAAAVLELAGGPKGDATANGAKIGGLFIRDGIAILSRR